MPGDPKECRQRAARCLELAADAANEGIKQMFLNIAKHWETLASELERTKKMLDDEKGALKLVGKPRRKRIQAKGRKRKKKSPATVRTKRSNGFANWGFLWEP
jgi:hypothetical protein